MKMEIDLKREKKRALANGRSREDDANDLGFKKFHLFRHRGQKRNHGFFSRSIIVHILLWTPTDEREQTRDHEQNLALQQKDIIHQGSDRRNRTS